ncbi:hypothetical protein WN51_01256 [Melipona quadrifasciata]|uniref:Uncharacterized protein n=1 Tax=Melipona quadrifasciata TaxID=166423 RepID=A0A0N0BF78_9HYME|nr:hypothetical protein WN51_01256 [Melipona quadrifasciata]
MTERKSCFAGWVEKAGRGRVIEMIRRLWEVRGDKGVVEFAGLTIRLFSNYLPLCRSGIKGQIEKTENKLLHCAFVGKFQGAKTYETSQRMVQRDEFKSHSVVYQLLSVYLPVPQSDSSSPKTSVIVRSNNFFEKHIHHHSPNSSLALTILQSQNFIPNPTYPRFNLPVSRFPANSNTVAEFYSQSNLSNSTSQNFTPRRDASPQMDSLSLAIIIIHAQFTTEVHFLPGVPRHPPRNTSKNLNLSWQSCADIGCKVAYLPQGKCIRFLQQRTIYVQHFAHSTIPLALLAIQYGKALFMTVFDSDQKFHRTRDYYLSHRLAMPDRNTPPPPSPPPSPPPPPPRAMAIAAAAAVRARV